MLKRVKIQGYKSLADVEVNLQPLSVLLGPNASGKSNFLDALQFLSRIATSDNINDAFKPPYRGKPLESFTFGPDGIQGLLVQERASFFIEIDVELSQNIVDTVNRKIRELEETRIEGGPSKDRPESIKRVLVSGRYLRYRIEIETIPKNGILNIIDEYLVELDANGTPTDRRIRMERDRLNLYREGGVIHFGHMVNQSMLSLPYYLPYHPHLIAMHEELANWFFYYLEPRERMRVPSPVREVRHIGLRGEELDAFLNTLHAIDEPQFKAVEKALHMLIPSITGIDVSIDNYGDVELKLMQGQKPLSTRVLSEGTLRILGLLALGGAKELPTLISFEEPENGIHPDRLDLIVLLLETLVSGDTQVIATTHSPTLVDLVPRESLFMFRQINGNTVINPLSTLKKAKGRKPNLNNSSNADEELTVSERLLRGDFYA